MTAPPAPPAATSAGSPGRSRIRGGLSTRGVALGAGGASAAVAAAVLGEPDLVRLGIFVTVLPLLSLAWTLLVLERGCRDLTTHRVALPTHAASGTPVTVTLQLRRPAGAGGSAGSVGSVGSLGSLGSLGSVLAEDLLPVGVSRRADPPRLLLGSGRAEAGTTYTLVPLRRGRLVLGPTLVRPSSPLGLCDRRGELPGTTEIVVAPRVVALTPTPRLRQPAEIGDHRPRRPGSAPAEDASLRPYRRGDDLRLVHWRSTARRGELQVRDGVDLRVPRSLVVLDDVGPAGQAFESAVDLAASVGVHLLGLDHDLDLLAPASGGDVRRCRTGEVLLDRLAEVESAPAAAARSTGRDPAGTAPARLGVGTGDVLVLCTRVDADTTALAGWLPHRPSRSPAIALVAGGSDVPAGLGALLVSRGWVTRGVSTVEDLPQAWREDAPRAAVVAGGGR